MKPTTVILWAVYLGLLAVLLPHTAWAFQAFEPADSPVIAGPLTTSALVSYIAAFAFECAIAVLTHKLSTHIEQTAKEAKRLTGWARFSRQYVNAFSLGLIVATLVSSLANLAHAIQFGTTLKIFTTWGIPFALYAVAFGGILPFVSLLFARVLSNVNESEGVEDPAIAEAKAQVVEVRRLLREAESARKLAEARALEADRHAQEAEARFAAAGDLMRALVSEDKRARILAARQQWPQLPGAAIAVIAGAAPSYVSEVLKAEVVE